MGQDRPQGGDYPADPGEAAESASGLNLGAGEDLQIPFGKGITCGGKGSQKGRGREIGVLTTEDLLSLIKITEGKTAKGAMYNPQGWGFCGLASLANHRTLPSIY
ncbi:hypothetical protein FVE67_06575 [Thermosulfurimonas marina]|uniref:Uncharacterized protein n=1 Tax=Thermosulfurimonas marina TaxID=2047767 RepID=A0A6H1WTF4_9BACT|nr:hypothetical protein [Thermosulfurimonas marina]QJA06483.1 hypothetical protein FVE67_06575 [Thermosulfurimonas marina]